MKQLTLAIIVALATTFNAYGQPLFSNTARGYLPTATTFAQSQIDSFNSAVNYQVDIINGVALTYPDLVPISLTWNGTAWTSPTPVAITNAFTTPLMVGAISHTATTTAGALAPSIVVDWADVTGVTQYRFRIRHVGGAYNTSTITGSQRTLATLQYATTYEVQVRVYINSTTQGEYTSTYTFTTPSFVTLPTCNAPTTTASIVGNQLVINWASVNLANSYQVEIRKLGALSWGGTTINGTSFSMSIDTTKAYEYRVRTNCIGASTTWSAFSTTDTATKAVCTPPTGLYNVGNTFYFTPNQYATTTHFEHRLVGTTTWGGTSTTGNSVTITNLFGQHEWRVRNRCHSTTNTGWTAWTTAVTGFIVKPQAFEQFSNELAYPNPANDVVYLKGSIVIRDLTGRIVATGTDVLDVSQLADGLYFINGQKLTIKH